MNEVDDILFSTVLSENSEKEFQWRITVSKFRGVQYLGLRKYFLSFEGTWEPTKEGATMPLTINTTLHMMLALSDILSNAEIDLVKSEFAQLIKIYRDERREKSSDSSNPAEGE